MKLTDQNVHYYLTERGLLQEGNIMQGHYMAQQSHATRNNILRVHVNTGPSMFIKQCGTDTTSISVLKREASAYQLLHGHKSFADFSTGIPSLLDYDDQRNVLVTTLQPNTTSLHDHYLKTKTFPVELGARQAKLLAGYHKPLTGKKETMAFPHQLPWVFQLNDFNAYHLFPNNTENGKFIALIQQNGVLSNELQQLKLEWKKTHFIHGDIKWVNFLIGNGKEGPQLTLIDWELADIGDPCWDVAGLLQSYIAAWIFGFDNQQPTSYQLHAGIQSFELEHMQASIDSFLHTYAYMQGLVNGSRATWLIKVMRYTAARILQTAIEGVVFDPRIQANNMRCMQLAFNIFKDPEAALTHLLGIKP